MAGGGADEVGGRARVTVTRLRQRHRWIHHLARALERYRRDHIEYHALVVVSRGLFLTIATVMVFLHALSLITHVLPGTNEIVIPTVTMSDAQDLGAVVDGALAQFRGVVLGVVGIVTLVVSATFTARALRQGSRVVFAGAAARQVPLFAPSNLALGLGLAMAILCSWLLALSTAIRTAAIGAMIGVEVTRALVPLGKAFTVAVSFALLTLLVFVALRRAGSGNSRRTVVKAAVVLAAVIVAANFFLLYSYVGALINPNSSGGVVLVLTILTWVNAVVRALFLTECWIVEASD